MAPYYQDDAITIYHGDSQEIVPTLGKFDLLLTSPPYAAAREYIGYIQDDKKLAKIIALADANQKLVNVGQVSTNKEVDLYWLEYVNEARDNGELFYGMYIWDKLSQIPGRHHGRLAPSHEYILHFCKEKCELIETEHNKGAGQKRNSSDPRTSEYAKKRVFHTNIREKSVQRSVLSVASNRTAEDIDCNQHPATMPISLAKKLISIWPCQTILDPFSGSGTTGRAAKDLGKKATLIEMEEKYCEIAAKRMAQEMLF